MKDRTLRKEARLYFVPVLLGSNKLSHRISRKIFRKYGIVSLILDEKSSFRDVFSLTSRFVRVYSQENELLCQEICKIGEDLQYTLPIAVPTSPRFDKLTEEFGTVLETAFVLRSPHKLFSSSPLADIKQF